MNTPLAEVSSTEVVPVKAPPGLSVQAFWLTASKVIAALMNLAVPILLVRLLDQRDYGIYKQTFLFAGTAVGVSTLGVGVSAFYFMPRYPQKGGQIALNILIYNFVVGWFPLLVLILYPSVLAWLFRTDALLPLAIPIGVLAFLQLSSGLSQLLPTAMQDVKYSTAFIIGTQLAKSIAVTAAALWFRTVYAIVVSQIVFHLFTLGVLFWYLRRKFGRFWLDFDFGFFKEQLAYALPYGAIGIMWILQQDLDNYFVGALSGPTMYAIYSVGWLTLPFVPLFLESVGAVMVVRISALHQEGRTDDIRRVTASAINRLSAFQFPVFAFLMVAAHDLIILMYTQTYASATPIFRITILMIPVQAFLVDPIVRSYKNLRTPALIVRVVSLIILFSSLAPTIRHFGMMGAAALAIGLRLLEALFMGWMASRCLETHARDLRLLAESGKVIAVTVVASILAALLRRTVSPNHVVARILIAATAMALVYLPASFILRLPGSELLSRKKLLALVVGGA